MFPRRLRLVQPTWFKGDKLNIILTIEHRIQVNQTNLEKAYIMFEIMK